MFVLFLVDARLSRSCQDAVMCCKGRVLSPHGKVHGKATESTVEILYRLGTHQDDELRTRYDETESLKRRGTW